MILSLRCGMICVVLFYNLEHNKTTHTFEVFPFKNIIREQSVTASLHREMICVVHVVGSTPRSCAVHQFPRNKETFYRASFETTLNHYRSDIENQHRI